jgi:hypothetical protein
MKTTTTLASLSRERPGGHKKKQKQTSRTVNRLKRGLIIKLQCTKESQGFRFMAYGSQHDSRRWFLKCSALRIFFDAVAPRKSYSSSPTRTTRRDEMSRLLNKMTPIRFFEYTHEIRNDFGRYRCRALYMYVSLLIEINCPYKG